MFRAVILAAVAFASVTPIFSVPIGISTPVRIPGLMTVTAGFVGPSEIPSPNMGAVSPPPRNFKHNMFGELERRQFRIADHNIGTNMSTAQDSANGLEDVSGPLRKRNAKENKETGRSRKSGKKTHTVDPPPPSPLPSSNSPAAPASQDPKLTKVVSSALSTLGKLRQNASTVVHEVLADVFSAQDSTEGSADDSSLPDPTEDTKTRREVLPDTYFRTPLFARHSLMFDTDTLLPPPPDSSAMQQDAAWKKTGLVNLDSNRSPAPIPAVPQKLNTTEAAPALDAAKGAASGTALSAPPSAPTGTAKAVETHVV
ncbi:hypothetical protein B0H21DRAFT_707620 [Amylocystis lapponica]|nr:hypothetical protein B0H21DRAFT_707620 [Amylocystis lapponica]